MMDPGGQRLRVRWCFTTRARRSMRLCRWKRLGSPESLVREVHNDDFPAESGSYCATHATAPDGQMLNDQIIAVPGDRGLPSGDG